MDLSIPLCRYSSVVRLTCSRIKTISRHKASSKSFCINHPCNRLGDLNACHHHMQSRRQVTCSPGAKPTRKYRIGSTALRKKTNPTLLCHLTQEAAARMFLHFGRAWMDLSRRCADFRNPRVALRSRHHAPRESRRVYTDC